MFQTKNTYSNISKNYQKGNICFAGCKTIYSPKVLLVDYALYIRCLYGVQGVNFWPAAPNVI